MLTQFKPKMVIFLLGNSGPYTYSWFNKDCLGHWELSNGKLLFGGLTGKSLHCSVCPNAQSPTFIETVIDSVHVDSREATTTSYKWHPVISLITL